MIDLKKVLPSKNIYVDGELEDGRLVEFKTKMPHKFDDLIRMIVTIANTSGGFIIFGIDDKTHSIVGIDKDDSSLINKLELYINKHSFGILYQITTHKLAEDKIVVILEIKKALSTAYFSRIETSPARQIAYKYTKNSQNGFSILKEEMRYTKVFKYMTLEAFLISLYSSTWRFFEPSKWNDKFEQRFYCANYVLPTAKGNTPQLFATCLTKVKNSDAAWKVYSNGQGLGAHCLQLELDIVELRKQLRATGYQFEEKIVEYKPENVILDLHKKREKYYIEYFSSFTLNSFLNLLSMKRDAYTYEQEIRMFIIPVGDGERHKYKKAQHKDLTIDWRDVITKVRIDKKCSAAELVSVQRACLSVGINPIIKNYTFIGNNNINPPYGLKDVEFEVYDIDDMPGTSSITIS